jgi:hypothetical protein
LLSVLLLLPVSAFAEEPVRLVPGKDYATYSNEELRRRVWQLERAVTQLQEQVFQLALRERSPGPGHGSGGGTWTCQIQSFGKTFVAAGLTKASALAQALKKCSDATNAIHCSEKDVKCDDE